MDASAAAAAAAGLPPRLWLFGCSYGFGYVCGVTTRTLTVAIPVAKTFRLAFVKVCAVDCCRCRCWDATELLASRLHLRLWLWMRL